MFYTIKFMMESLHALPSIDFSKFIDVYGNSFRRQHFIAMRFKRAIISYKCSVLDKTPIEPPDNSIIVIRGPRPPINLKNVANILLFTLGDEYNGGISVNNESHSTLLRALFPSNKIIYSYCLHSTLYMVATENPFRKIMKKCPKTVAFYTLVSILEAKINKRLLTLDEIANFRFFKRCTGDLGKFNRWSPFAFHLCFESFFPVTNTLPSECIGREIFKILKRSDDSPEHVIDSDFYQCEVFFTESEPVGIMCLFSTDKCYNLEYVSPMVVKNTNKSFKDSNSIECDTWLPLYKNKKTWKNYGLLFYVHNLSLKKTQLVDVLLWLQIQTAEKYRLLYIDLVQIAKILFNDNETRWFLKP